jgi:hypothetical protein
MGGIGADWGNCSVGVSMLNGDPPSIYAGSIGHGKICCVPLGEGVEELLLGFTAYCSISTSFVTNRIGAGLTTLGDST